MAKAVRAKTQAEPAAGSEAETDELMRRARHGDQQAANQIITALATVHGEQWGTVLPTPAEKVRGRLLQASMGEDLLARATWERQAASLQRELEGPTPTPLERTLCERVATCWLDMQITDLASARVHGKAELTKVVSDYWQQRQDRAQRRYLDATMALARTRRLLAPVIAQVNIAQAGAQQLNISAQEAAAALAASTTVASELRQIDRQIDS
jgi:hypothetical protein